MVLYNYKMVSKLNLIKIVEANDYETLEKIIMENKTEINFCLHKNSLINKAVEVRSKECFDLLINSPNYTYHQNNYMYNGTEIAMKYYKISQNPTNEYYLMKLIENKADCYEILDEIIKNPKIFSFYFDKIDKNKNNIDRIITYAIFVRNSDAMTLGLDYGLSKKWNLDLNEYMDSCYQRNYYEGAKILIEKGCQLKILNKLPNIYAILQYEDDDEKAPFFDLFYQQLLKLDKNELNQIPKIKNLNNIWEIDTKIIWKNNIFFSDFWSKCLVKILKLDIEWEDINKFIKDKFFIGLKEDVFIAQSNFSYFDNNLLKLNAFLKNYKLNFNLFDDFTIKTFSNVEKVIKNSNYDEKLCNKFAELIFLFEHYGYNIQPSLMNELRNRKLIQISPDNWEKSKKLFIKKIEKIN